MKKSWLSAVLVTMLVAIGMIALWGWASGPAMFVLCLIATDLAGWIVAAVWTSANRRLFVMRFVAAHSALLLMLALLELPVVLGLVDYRLVLGTPIPVPMRDPRYLPDPELLYLPRPGDRRVGSTGRSDISFSFHVPEPASYPYDVAYDERGFRNAAGMNRADVVVVGDSFVVNNYVPSEQVVTSVLARDLGITVYNLAHVGYGPQQEDVLIRRYALALRPRVVVWVFFEGNDLEDIYVYRSLTADFSKARAERHGIPARSFVRNAAERLMNLFGNPRRPAPFAWWIAGGARERLSFLYGATPLSERHERALVDFEGILGRVAAQCQAAGAQFVLAFAPDKFRACRRQLHFDPGASTASWTLNDLPDRLRAIASRLPGAVPYVDLTSALATRSDAGELPYFRDDSHWNTAGNRIAGEALAEAVRPLVAKER
jgi:hypothetical protein